jgi:putative selenate reductase
VSARRRDITGPYTVTARHASPVVRRPRAILARARTPCAAHPARAAQSALMPAARPLNTGVAMGGFRPIPFSVLCRRMLREAERGGPIFDLPARRFVLGAGGHDVAVQVHGQRAATPLGPAAGPHTQLAQNIVLSWLAGGRTIELKTVQVKDDLEIARPCIDARTVGYNVEWSQELRLHESLDEYVKASMLLDILKASGHLAMDPAFGDTVFEASVGYDLRGIASEKVQGFLRGIADARAVIDRLRGEIPDEFSRFRDLDFRTRIASGVTLSTFHGCPPGEIEQVAELLARDDGLPVVIKLNPTLLGPRDLRRLLHDVLGYRDVVVPDAAFTRDLQWDDALALVDRARRRATARGVGFGIKLTNTLVVENRAGYLPASEKEAYLSGAPLHVLAIELVRRFRRNLGAELPISFSAGIDADNFSDAVALGLAPVTVCTDWLKAGGYGRAQRYFTELKSRMDEVGAKTREDFVLHAGGGARAALAKAGADPERLRACERALAAGTSLREAAGEALYARWVAEAAKLNSEAYADAIIRSPRYTAAANGRAPKKTGVHLTLLDCIACDKCIPVCPNDANFAFVLPEAEIPRVLLTKTAAGWTRRDEGALRLGHDHQIGNTADACNACGNCDVFCPEDGGPHKVKPRFFGSAAAFRANAKEDGLFVEREGARDRVLARVGGREVEVEVEGGRARFSGAGFAVRFDAADPEGSIEGEATVEVDLGLFRIVDGLRRAVLAAGASNFVSTAR